MEGFSAIFHAQYLFFLWRSIELLRTFLTYNSYSLVFQKTFSLQPSTSFLWQWWLVGIWCSIAQASVHVTGFRWVLVTAIRGSEWGRRGMLKSSVVLVEMVRNVCILHFFLLQTVNGKAGLFGTAPKAVLSYLV